MQSLLVENHTLKLEVGAYKNVPGVVMSDLPEENAENKVPCSTSPIKKVQALKCDQEDRVFLARSAQDDAETKSKKQKKSDSDHNARDPVAALYTPSQTPIATPIPSQNNTPVVSAQSSPQSSPQSHTRKVCNVYSFFEFHLN